MRRQGALSLTKVLLTAVVVAALSVVQVQASGSTVEYEAPFAMASDKPIWVVGLGVASVPDYEGSDDYKGAPVPLVKYVNPKGWYIELVANTLRANVLPSKTFKLGPLVRLRGERDDVDNDRVDLMEKVESTIEFGGFLGLSMNNWDFKIEIASDVNDGDDKVGKKEGHGGSISTFSGGYTFRFGKQWTLAVSAFATHASDEYMQTYFGVDAADSATSSLPVYKAEGGLKDAGATVVATYDFKNNWGLLFGGRLAALSGDAADSPLVDQEGSESQFLSFGVVTYTF